MAKKYFITELNIDEEITDFFMVKDASVKIGANHKNYLDITLSDKSGEINAKKWDVSDDEALVYSAFETGNLVKVAASVSEWNGIKQLRINKIRKAVKEDMCVITDYIKAAPEDPEKMHGFMVEKAESIGDEDLKKLCLKFLTDEKERLLYYPGAMRNHHAEQAGLLYHMKRMLALGEKACEVYDMLDRDWVIAGVILHDMEKLNEIESNELGISPGYSFEGNLLGHILQGIVKVSDMCRELGIPDEKRIMLEHMIAAHHYEPDFGSPKKPMFPEAELLHYLDMLDAKLFDFEDALSGVKPGEFSERVRTLDGRLLYKYTDSKIK